ncbi:MAG: hypothetical protein EOP04_07625 [Proteobacteria bacterium]|nr:MAG: hypothetical protein EOP04_07625 [Pseudomonadota bacterium]
MYEGMNRYYDEPATVIIGGGTQFFLGLDLGQSKDYTAIAVVEKIDPPRHPPRYGSSHGDLIDPDAKKRYECRHLERLPLGTKYPDIVSHVQTMMENPQLKGKTELVVDATGVGRPVVDMFAGKGLSPRGIMITGGNAVTQVGDYTGVPKRDLVSTLQALMQQDRLGFAKSLPMIDSLVAEMMAFQVKITTSANDIYGAWREGTNDDLVLAVALATWRAEQHYDIIWCVA